MAHAPQPVVMKPLFKAKPWGGRRLQSLFGKRLPANTAIGESWELVQLPDNESQVRAGPLAGRALGELMEAWGADLLGSAAPVDGRFPLLIKFLDACENLSVQVHPKPAPDDPRGTRPGIKHEAWYILHTEPGARLFIGLKDGVTPRDVARVANTPAIVEILHVWDAAPGQCYYLPSGTLHALGAGLVVAEVQTPSDITYRAYDWGRVGLDGRPRELHINDSLANIRYDVTPVMIRQPRAAVTASTGPATRVVACDRFLMDLVERPAGAAEITSAGRLRVWMILDGTGVLQNGSTACPFAAGDVVLLPAAATCTAQTRTACRWLETTIPH